VTTIVQMEQSSAVVVVVEVGQLAVAGLPEAGVPRLRLHPGRREAAQH
jgi:hypothetical protein